VPLEQLSHEAFAAQVKTSFRVRVAENESVILLLAEATATRIAKTGGARNVAYENFSLNFTGPMNRLLSQGTYLFESEKLGAFELFIVPVGRDQNGTYYQATFNRLVP